MIGHVANEPRHHKFREDLMICIIFGYNLRDGHHVGSWFMLGSLGGKYMIHNANIILFVFMLFYLANQPRVG